MGKDELRQLSKDDLVRLVLVLQDQIARLRKNSSTSSKPPSSDIVKPPKSKPKKGGKRKIGGQPGHKRHERKQLDADEIDFTVIYDPGVCPDCGGPLDETGHPPRVVDQIEVVARRRPRRRVGPAATRRPPPRARRPRPARCGSARARAPRRRADVPGGLVWLRRSALPLFRGRRASPSFLRPHHVPSARSSM